VLSNIDNRNLCHLNLQNENVPIQSLYRTFFSLSKSIRAKYSRLEVVSFEKFKKAFVFEV
jgi:hypothetical protein